MRKDKTEILACHKMIVREDQSLFTTGEGLKGFLG
jgi:hypothetical protein